MNKNFKISIAKIAGMLLIVAGIVGLINWAPFLVGEESYIDQIYEEVKKDDPDATKKEIKEALFQVGSVGIIFSIFSIIGGILSYQSKRWKITFFCSIIGLLSIIFLLIPGILCLLAIILLITGKNEFK